MKGLALIIYIYWYLLCHQISRRMRAVGWVGSSCFSLQSVRTKGSSLRLSRGGASFSQSTTQYPLAFTLLHPLTFQWKRLQLMILISMLPPTPAPLPSIERRPVHILIYVTAHTTPHIYTIADVSAEVSSASRNSSTSSGRSTRSSGDCTQV